MGENYTAIIIYIYIYIYGGVIRHGQGNNRPLQNECGGNTHIGISINIINR